MRSLAEIREKNKRQDLLFVGMEKSPVKLPTDLYDSEGRFYKSVIKPHTKQFIEKSIENKKW